MVSGLLILAAAWVVGAILASSGAVLQGVLRNPLAEPYMLGVVGGAALAAALVMMLGGGTTVSELHLVGASFVGGCTSLGLVFGVAALAHRLRSRGGADAAMRSSHSTLILAGFAVASFTGSLQMLLLTYADKDVFTALYRRLFGTLAAVTPFTLGVATCGLVGGLVGIMCLAKRLNVMELGLDEAECLGVNTKRTLAITLTIVSLMTAVAVALAGAIGFVGLVIPHLVRRLCGTGARRCVLVSAASGGVFLAVMSLVARLLPGEVPVGVVAAVALAPCFLGILAVQYAGEGRDV